VIITKVQQQKNNSSRYSIYVDDNFFAGISAKTLTKYNLYKNKDIKKETLDEILISELKQRFQQRAERYLSRAIKTESQVRRYLNDLKYKKKGKWFDENIYVDFDKIFDQIINRLKELQYIDDKKFAELFVQSRIRNKPRGKYVLVSELLKKGVDKELAKLVCDEIIEDEFEILKHTYYKKYKEEILKNDDRKKIQYLQRKGFSYDLIKKYIENESEK
jgi:regulatory protein